MMAQNIFHGSMGLHQLYYTRPTRDASGYGTPLKGYYICGSGAHPGQPAHAWMGPLFVLVRYRLTPGSCFWNVCCVRRMRGVGGGVMGAAGRNAAQVVLRQHPS